MRNYFLFLILLLSLSSYGQVTGRLVGRVVDSASGAPLDYATVTLQRSGDLKPLNGTTTDKSGKFVIADVREGTYALLIEFVGYSSFSIKDLVVDKVNTVVDVRIVRLARRGAVLQGVTVTAGGRLVSNKVDKLVYNAERDLTAQSGSATDLLKKVPQVSVDVNGNVELAGTSSIRFLINGKPSAAFGNSIADVLQSIPASQIKSIEVVTNPGAKYDAQGLGGIINIILKQNTAQGINGNLSLAAGTRAENGSFNFNARKGGFGLNAFVSGNFRPAANALVTTERNTTDTGAKTTALLRQQGASRSDRHGFQSGLGFDWTIKEKSTLAGSVSYNRFGNSTNGHIDQSQVLRRQDDGSVLSDASSATYTRSSFAFDNIDASLSYKRTFAKEDQELEIAVNSSLGKNRNRSDNYQLALPAAARFYGNNSVNDGKENETEVDIDYAQPLKKDVNLGIGSKFVATDITSASNVLSFQPASGTYLYDAVLSNSLRYHQKVYAFYSELGFPLAKLFDAKIGGRYERTEIASTYSNAQQQVATPGYNTVVPSVFLSRKIGEDQVVKLSYSKRIERPDYGDLNPYINTSDPKNLSSGNPYLLPEVGHRLELGYSRELGKAGSFLVTLFARSNKQDIQPFVRYYPVFRVGDSIYTNVSVTTRQNIGTEKNTGVNLFADLHPGDKLSVRTNVSFFYRHTINLQDKGYNSSSFNYRFNLNLTYQFSGTLLAEMFGNFNSPRNEAQGRYPSFTTYSMAVRKQFWNKKGSLALTATNPFARYVDQRTELFGPNFVINSFRQIPFRSFGINFTWKFGRLEFKKEKESSENMAPPAES